MENIARKKVSQDFHARTVASLELQISSARKTSSSQESTARTEVARLTGLLKEKEDQIAGLEVLKTQVSTSIPLYIFKAWGSALVPGQDSKVIAQVCNWRS